MEYMDMNLREVSFKLKEADKVKVALSIAKAMYNSYIPFLPLRKHLHHELPQKVIHRDLKPENVMVFIFVDNLTLRLTHQESANWEILDLEKS